MNEAGKIPHVDWWDTLIAVNEETNKVDQRKTDELLPRSDVTAAQVISRRMPHTLSFGSQTGTWRIWNGRVHELDNAGLVGKILQAFCHTYRDALERIKLDYQNEAELARAALGETVKEEEKEKAYAGVMKKYQERWKKHRAFRDRLFSDSGQKALLSQLRVHSMVDDAEYDVLTDLLVCENGVIELKQLFEMGAEDLELLPHDPRRRVTKMMPVRFDPHSVSEDWNRYVRTALPVREIREYLWKAAASSLTGNPQHKAIMNLIGAGDSGKSVFLDSMLSVMGEYAMMAPTKVFLAKHSESSFDLNGLKGSRFVCSSEPGRGKRFDDTVLKSLSGRDIQTTDAKNQHATSWKPQCLIFIASNHPVKFDTTDGAFLQRIKPVTFPVVFLDPDKHPGVESDRRMDRQLENKLRRKEDQEAILLWLLEGLEMYFREGLVDPEALNEARDEMQLELEPVLQWVQEMVDDGRMDVIMPGEVASNHCAKVADLYSAFQMWAFDQGGDVRRMDPGLRAFSKVLQSKYGPTVKSAGTRFPTLVGVRPATVSGT